MALMNQFLEEAIERCIELARLATESASEAEDILLDADALGELAHGEADALHEAFVHAVAVIQGAREQIAREIDDAAAALTDLAADAGQATAAAEKVLATVREGAGPMQQLRTRLGESIEVETDAAEVATVALGDAGGSYSSRLEAGLETATEGANSLGGLAAQAGDLIERAAGAFTQGLGALSSTAMQVTMDLIAAVDATLLALGAQALDFGNLAITHHNDAVGALRTGFTDEEPGHTPLPADDAWPGRALAVIGDAAAELALLRDSAQEAVRTAVPGFAEQAGAATQKLFGIVAAVEGLFPLEGA